MNNFLVISILLPTSVSKTFYYAADEDIKVGQLVLVKLKNREIFGIVWEITDIVEKNLPFKLSRVISSFKIFFQKNIIEFINWFSEYNFFQKGLALKTALPLRKNEMEKIINEIQDVKEENDVEVSCKEKIELSDIQTYACEKIFKKNSFSVDVLDGVTGSGKTEVYIEIIRKRLQTEKDLNQVLILLPEIVLTEQLIERFKKYLNIEPEIWHSNTTIARKRKIWLKAVMGKRLVVIGARSSLFLPFKNLNTIILDEEHDSSYKQNEQGFYNARDMAIVRAKIENRPIILASATPSLETMHNIQIGKYDHVKLESRFSNAKLPEIRLVDMREEAYNPIISSELSKAVKTALMNKEQVLLFVNQRGYAPVSICKVCGFRWKCEKCDVNLIEHRVSNVLRCHYCGLEKKIENSCPMCKAEDSKILLGIGTERLLEAVNVEFPSAKAIVLSSDTVSSKKALTEAFNMIHNRQVDIIIGTQILAKGHHFSNLTVVGIIEADRSMNGCDLRANEKTYNLLHQVAGRAGREKKQGVVFLQTYTPAHPLMQSLLSGERNDFYEYELQDRKKHEMPPFNSLISIIISGLAEIEVIKEAQLLGRNFPLIKEIELLGPAPSPILKIQGKYRYRFLIKHKKGVNMYKTIKNWLGTGKNKTIEVLVDVDPQEFL